MTLMVIDIVIFYLDSLENDKISDLEQSAIACSSVYWP